MYLPLLNTLLEESLSWTKPNAASEEPWFNSDKKFKEIDNWQRANETREAAVRCLMLFPLNALVEDQNTRLRKIFTGTRGKELSNLINGNRIYFGSYKGESGGSPNLNTSKFDELKKSLKEIKRIFKYMQKN